MRYLLTYLTAAFLLVACGLKGPLYLPERTTELPEKTSESQTVPAEEEREAQDNKADSPLIHD